MFTMIQHPTKTDRRALISLEPGSYVAPAGYVVGGYRTVFPCLTREAAIKVLAAHFQRDHPVALWWCGAAEDIAAVIAN